jgi:glucokinase
MKEIATKLILAADLGGTKVAAALISPLGEILARKQEPTRQFGPQDGISQITRLLTELLEENSLDGTDILCIGIGIPAVLEPDTDLVIWAPNLKDWRNIKLRPALEQAFGLPVFIEYDGHTAVLGEWWVGNGRGYDSIVNVIIGTGIGGGMILDGHLYRGRNRLAGAAGWFTLTTNPDCQDERASSLGFWESIAAGPGFAYQTKSLLGSHPDSLLNLWNQEETLTAQQVFRAAQQGDNFANKMVNILAGWLGLGVANIISLVNPEIIILGGGVGSNCSFILSEIQEVARGWAQPISAKNVIITTSKLGTEAGLLGAAYGALLRQNHKP